MASNSFVAATLKLLILATCPGASALKCEDTGHFNYRTVSGVFLQDEPTTDPSTFDYKAKNFGLMNRSYPSDGPAANTSTQWQRFEAYVSQLNAQASDTTQYKLLIMGRHGEGFHNAAESFYGTPAWNCYWAELDGNGTAIWRDAHLTEVGHTQARTANTFWASQIRTQKQSLPQSYYVSPLYRSLQTINITFDNLPGQSFCPTIKEFLRESVSLHTCDSRSNRTHIAASFPMFRFERGFSEEDPLWTGKLTEPSGAQAQRSRALLDDVFGNDKSTIVSFTSHSGEIASILAVLGHGAFRLATGAVIPVLVQAEVQCAPASATSAPWMGETLCAAPPMTSIAGTGCVCPVGLASAAAMATAMPTRAPRV